MAINRRKGRFPILLLHRVSPEVCPYSDPVPPERFDDYLKCLQREGYSFVTADQLVSDDIKTGDPCCITFDDGTLDFFQYALPVLKRHQVPFIQFVPTKLIGSRNRVWTYDLFDYARNVDTDLNQSSVDKLIRELRGISINARKESLEKYKRKNESRFHMDWNEITICLESGDIGSHSRTHPDLSSLEDQNELHSEVAGSMSDLTTNCVECGYFSYPFGSCSDDSKLLCRSYYKAAFATGETLARLSNIESSRYELPRITVMNEHPCEFIFRVCGFHSLVRKTGSSWLLKRASKS